MKPGLIVDNPSESFLRFLHDMADFFAGQPRDEGVALFTVEDLRKQDAMLDELGKDTLGRL